VKTNSSAPAAEKHLASQSAVVWRIIHFEQFRDPR
jgi:hypothetical protein